MKYQQQRLMKLIKMLLKYNSVTMQILCVFDTFVLFTNFRTG